MRCAAKVGIKFRRGDTSPEHPGLVFSRYKDGKEQWLAPGVIEKIREKDRIKKRSWIRSAHTKARQREYARSPKVRERVKRHLNTQLGKRLRGVVRMALKRYGDGSRRTDSFNELLGCTIPEFRAHIEAQFSEGMTWGNIQIDHILPCAFFDLTDRKQQLACFNFRNCRPLFQKDNISKGDKIEGELFRGRELKKIIQFKAA